MKMTYNLCTGGHDTYINKFNYFITTFGVQFNTFFFFCPPGLSKHQSRKEDRTKLNKQTNKHVVAKKTTEQHTSDMIVK